MDRLEEFLLIRLSFLAGRRNRLQDELEYLLSFRYRVKLMLGRARGLPK